MRKRVIILGSTGSIGQRTIEVLDGLAGEWDLAGLAAGSRHRRLAEQANRYRPEAVALAVGQAAPALQAKLDYSPRVFTGDDALVELVENVACDCVVSAVVGVGGLAATVRAIELGRRVALANKEAMVIAGSVIMRLVRSTDAEIVPVDSEHSAIFQAMQAGRPADVRAVYLTGSGGPFRTWSAEAMEDVTVEEALHHPTWDMGPKITVDSATMMNKALEIVEARWLFDLDPARIEVVIHPESIIHSMVEFCDGSLIAQLGTPDMRTPIQYALTYPKRASCPSKRLNLAEIGRLSFEHPDHERFPAIRLGYEAAKLGGTAGAVLSAANEAAVDLFRQGIIRFPEIVRHTEQALKQHEFKESPTLEDLLHADRWARQEVTRCLAC